MSTSKYQLEIGTTIHVPNGRRGILKFIGNVEDKPGLFAGIELTDGSPGRNNGDYHGKTYFKVSSPRSGIFYSYDTIVLCNNSADAAAAKRSSMGAVVSAATKKTIKNKRLSLDSQMMMKSAPRRSFSSTLHTNLESNNDKRSSTLQRRTTIERSPSMNTTSVFRNNELMNQINSLTKQHETLLEEKRQLAAELCNYKAQLDDKVSLLNGYKESIDNELKPAIEDYKYQLQQKETKLVKIKQQADQQRDELRDAISALEDQASENAEIYTTEVQNLKAKINEHEQTIEALNKKIDMVGNGDNSIWKKQVEEQSKVILSLQSQVDERELIIKSLNKNDGHDDFSFVNEDSNKVSDKELEALKSEFEKIQIDTRKLTNKIIEKDQTIQNLSDELALLRNELDLKNSLMEKNKQLSELQFKDHLVMQDNQNHIETLKSTYEAEIKSKNNEIDQLNLLLKDLSLQKQKLFKTQDESSEIERLRLQLQARDQEISRLKKNSLSAEMLNEEILSLQQKNAILTEKTSELNTLKSQLDSKDSKKLTNELSQKDKEIEELRNNIEVIELLNQQIESLKTGNDALVDHEEDLMRQFDDLRYRHSQIESVLVEKNQEINTLKKQYESARADKENLKAELAQLKTESDLSEEVHKEEITEKDVQIKELQAIIAQLEKKLLINDNGWSSQRKNNNSVSSIDTSGSVFSPNMKRLSNSSIDDHVEEKQPTLGIEKKKLRYSSTPEVIQGELPIYKPATTVDASAGRAKWCGLCEREGHDSYECPFENDIF